MPPLSILFHPLFQPRFRRRRTSPWRWLALLLMPLGDAWAACPRCGEIAEHYARDWASNGVVQVGQGAQVDYVGAFGMADVESARPVSVDTRFESGSIAKWIAAIVVLRLVEQGRLALDEPISSYLPDYRRDSGRQLTLRWLMSHSSGVPNQIDAAVKRDPAIKEQSLDIAIAVARYASGDPVFTPGTDWDYSHSNWLIVKAIVEQASRRRYPDLVDAWLVQPLQLRNAGIYAGDSQQVAGAAIGYAGLQPLQRLRKPTPDFMMLAGGCATSTGDLQQLMDAVFTYRLLSPGSVEALLTVIRPAQIYPLGGRVKSLRLGGQDRRVAWEYGSNGAFRLLAWRVLEDGRSVVIANNTRFDHMKMGELATALLEAGYEARP